MILTNTLLASSALYAYLKQRRRNNAIEIVSSADNVVIESEIEAAQHYAAVSSLSLGLTLAGILVAYPLALATIPLNIYTNLPLFEEAIATLAGKDEKRRSIIYSLILSGALASNHLLTANLLDWLIQNSRLLKAKLQQQGHEMTQVMADGVQNWVKQAMGKKPEKVWVVNEETADYEIPFTELRVGDEVWFREGEFISVSGWVTYGEAQIFDWSWVGNIVGQPIDRPIHFTVGDSVTPRMMVLKGELHVRVESLA